MDNKKDDNLKKGETKPKKGFPHHYFSYYDEPGLYSEYGTRWGPGDPYKPWIYGK